MIRPCLRSDIPVLTAIYNHYIETTTISFEETPISHVEMERRMQEGGDSFPWLVRELEGRVIGYAYARSWNTRSAYRFSAESTIYLDPRYLGRGLGHELYRELIEQLRDRSFHRVVAGIALPNEASVRIHERFGFEKAGHLPEIGFKLGRWIDVGYWVLRLKA